MVARSEVLMHHVSGSGFSERWLRPQTSLGKRAVALIAASFVLFIAFFAFVASGQRGGESFFSNLWLSATILPAAGLAIAGGAVGLYEYRDTFAAQQLETQFKKNPNAAVRRDKKKVLSVILPNRKSEAENLLDKILR